ncbi:MAG: hypothetical protein MZV64_28345 [Ignavibacteriales bacterium]|nr:hypothetical protein [Ignavibacteriales bacterium]
MAWPPTMPAAPAASAMRRMTASFRAPMSGRPSSSGLARRAARRPRRAGRRRRGWRCPRRGRRAASACRAACVSLSIAGRSSWMSE